MSKCGCASRSTCKHRKGKGRRSPNLASKEDNNKSSSKTLFEETEIQHSAISGDICKDKTIVETLSVSVSSVGEGSKNNENFKGNADFRAVGLIEHINIHAIEGKDIGDKSLKHGINNTHEISESHLSPQQQIQEKTISSSPSRTQVPRTVIVNDIHHQESENTNFKSDVKSIHSSKETSQMVDATKKADPSDQCTLDQVQNFENNLQKDVESQTVENSEKSTHARVDNRDETLVSSEERVNEPCHQLISQDDGFGEFQDDGQGMDGKETAEIEVSAPYFLELSNTRDFFSKLKGKILDTNTDHPREITTSVDHDPSHSTPSLVSNSNNSCQMNTQSLMQSPTKTLTMPTLPLDEISFGATDSLLRQAMTACDIPFHSPQKKAHGNDATHQLPTHENFTVPTLQEATQTPSSLGLASNGNSILIHTTDPMTDESVPLNLTTTHSSSSATSTSATASKKKIQSVKPAKKSVSNATRNINSANVTRNVLVPPIPIRFPIVSRLPVMNSNSNHNSHYTPILPRPPVRNLTTIFVQQDGTGLPSCIILPPAGFNQPIVSSTFPTINTSLSQPSSMPLINNVAMSVANVSSCSTVTTPNISNTDSVSAPNVQNTSIGSDVSDNVSADIANQCESSIPTKSKKNKNSKKEIHKQSGKDGDEDNNKSANKKKVDECYVSKQKVAVCRKQEELPSSPSKAGLVSSYFKKGLRVAKTSKQVRDKLSSGSHESKQRFSNNNSLNLPPERDSSEATEKDNSEANKTGLENLDLEINQNDFNTENSGRKFKAYDTEFHNYAGHRVAANSESSVVDRDSLDRKKTKRKILFTKGENLLQDDEFENEQLILSVQPQDTEVDTKAKTIPSHKTKNKKDADLEAENLVVQGKSQEVAKRKGQRLSLYQGSRIEISDSDDEILTVLNKSDGNQSSLHGIHSIDGNSSTESYENPKKQTLVKPVHTVKKAKGERTQDKHLSETKNKAGLMENNISENLCNRLSVSGDLEGTNSPSKKNNTKQLKPSTKCIKLDKHFSPRKTKEKNGLCAQSKEIEENQHDGAVEDLGENKLDSSQKDVNEGGSAIKRFSLNSKQAVNGHGKRTMNTLEILSSPISKLKSSGQTAVTNVQNKTVESGKENTHVSVTPSSIKNSRKGICEENALAPIKPFSSKKGGRKGKLCSSFSNIVRNVYTDLEKNKLKTEAMEESQSSCENSSFERISRSGSRSRAKRKRISPEEAYHVEPNAKIISCRTVKIHIFDSSDEIIEQSLLDHNPFPCYETKDYQCEIPSEGRRLVSRKRHTYSKGSSSKSSEIIGSVSVNNKNVHVKDNPIETANETSKEPPILTKTSKGNSQRPVNMNSSKLIKKKGMGGKKNLKTSSNDNGKIFDTSVVSDNGNIYSEVDSQQSEIVHTNLEEDQDELNKAVTALQQADVAWEQSDQMMIHPPDADMNSLTSSNPISNGHRAHPDVGNPLVNSLVTITTESHSLVSPLKLNKLNDQQTMSIESTVKVRANDNISDVEENNRKQRVSPHHRTKDMHMKLSEGSLNSKPRIESFNNRQIQSTNPNIDLVHDNMAKIKSGVTSTNPSLLDMSKHCLKRKHDIEIQPVDDGIEVTLKKKTIRYDKFKKMNPLAVIESSKSTKTQQTKFNSLTSGNKTSDSKILDNMESNTKSANHKSKNSDSKLSNTADSNTKSNYCKSKASNSKISYIVDSDTKSNHNLPEASDSKISDSFDSKNKSVNNTPKSSDSNMPASAVKFKLMNTLSQGSSYLFSTTLSELVANLPVPTKECSASGDMSIARGGEQKLLDLSTKRDKASRQNTNDGDAVRPPALDGLRLLSDIAVNREQYKCSRKDSDLSHLHKNSPSPRKQFDSQQFIEVFK